MEKIIKLLESLDDSNILIAIELIKNQYKDPNREWNNIMWKYKSKSTKWGEGEMSHTFKLYQAKEFEKITTIEDAWKIVFGKRAHAIRLYNKLLAHSVVYNAFWRTKYWLKF